MTLLGPRWTSCRPPTTTKVSIPKSGLTLACHGFLAKEAHEYAEYFARVLAQWKNDPAELQRLQKINQQVAHANFSAEHFSESFLSRFEPHIAPSQ